MEAGQLKRNFHQLIDSFDNDEILSKFYGLMSKINESKEGSLWNRLTKEEQESLVLADIEAEDPNNLIEHAAIQKKHNKWL